MAILQSHITEARVDSPANRVPGGVSPFPLQPSGSRGIDMASLHRHHVAVKSIRCPRDDELAPCGRADIPGGYGGVENVPVCKVLFLRDEVESGSPHYHALRMMTFIVRPGPVPLVGYDVRFWKVFFTCLISDLVSRSFRYRSSFVALLRRS